MLAYWLLTAETTAFNLTVVGLPVTVALAAVAVIGYVFGRRSREALQADVGERRRGELERAADVARKLESIADALRQDLAAHHARIDSFKRQLRKAQEQGDESAWGLVCVEAEAILAPTMQFAHQLSHAYDQIRQQSAALETFTQGRTDPLTGVGNGRALDRHLEVLLGAQANGNAGFVVALVNLDRNVHSSPLPRGDHPPLLPKLANVIRACMRDTDFVARLGEDDFVVVMPQTSLAGAEKFGDRLRQRVAQDLSATVSLGLAEARTGDDPKSLLARADSALYSAKATGANRLFVHTGTQIREQHPTAATAPDALQLASPGGRTDKPLPESDNSLASPMAEVSEARRAQTDDSLLVVSGNREQ